MITVKSIIKNGKIRGALMYGLRKLPDKLYIKLFYFSVFNRFPNLENPVGFNEKLNWLKLHNKNNEYRDLVDKLKVREYISSKLGSEYLFPLIGQWKSFDEIDFDSLPNEFVLKCNHDSGSVKIIKDKALLLNSDYKNLRDFFNKRLSHDFFYAGREYPYKGIDRFIFAEKLMKNDIDNSGITDYKFFCFDGEPKLLLTVSGRQAEKHEDYFDMDYNHLDIHTFSTPSNYPPQKPESFDKMKEICQTLTKDMKHVRLDFYEIGGKIYFGEFTFFSGGGFEPFHPDDWETLLGSWIKL